MENVDKFCKIVLSHEYLSDYTTFGIGGRAQKIAFPNDENELIALLGYLDEKGLPYAVLGMGSNTLVSDKGFQGVVVLTRKIKKISYENGKIYAECGVGLPALTKFSEFLSLTGAEFCTNIPASVGGAVRMNAGAFGSSVSDIVESVRIYKNGEIRNFSRDELGFGYRTSRVPELGVVLGASFALQKGQSERIAQKIAEFSQKRRESQPSGRSAGCVFKAHNGVSAGYLIDRAGLKGMRVGGAEVSDKHAGFILNTGPATASDVVKLLFLIQDVVGENFGVKLSTEICFLGEYDEDLRRLSHTYDI